MAEYKCSLDDASLKVAQNELNEDPKDRMSSVKALQKLLEEKNPHIKCPTDPIFLLAFLRARKFSQLEAKNLLENYLLKRQKVPDWCQELDPKNEAIQRVFDSGFMFVLPKRDDKGRPIVFFRPGYIDSKLSNYSKVDVLKAINVVLLFLMVDEYTQVNGLVQVFDWTKYDASHQRFLSLEERRTLFNLWQKSYPGRLKAIHLYNFGGFSDFILSLLKMAMSDKIQQRMIHHGNVLESIFDHIPQELLPVEYLPDEYNGPNAGTEKEIIEWMKTKMTSGDTYEGIVNYSKSLYQVDEKYRTNGIPQESFRKLTVD